MAEKLEPITYIIFCGIIKHYGLLEICKWKGEVMKAGHWEVCSSRYLCKRIADGMKRPVRRSL